MLKNHVGDWIINYCSTMNVWRATTRDNQSQLFNGGPDRISSSSLHTLVEIINRTNGDVKKINKLIK